MTIQKLDQVKERPILFSAPMVRAILDGSKTQTRRIVKPQPHLSSRQIGAAMPCPYGQPGDRLWVRETWQGPLVDDLDAFRAEPANYTKPEFCQYAADGGPTPEFMTMDDELVCRWRPSIHMPRWASRITLEVVSVRVERLCDISEGDAVAEGVIGDNYNGLDRANAREFSNLWEKINGPGSWDANPWVWVIEFKRIEGKQ